MKPAIVPSEAKTRDLDEPKARDAFAAIYQLQLHMDQRFDRLERMIEARDAYRLVTAPPPARPWWRTFAFWSW